MPLLPKKTVGRLLETKFFHLKPLESMFVLKSKIVMKRFIIEKGRKKINPS